MRLAGYLKVLLENSFAIPVYYYNEVYYFHNVDENYKIINFYNAEIEISNINQCYLSTEFNVNDFGAYVFVGMNNYINFNILSNSIFEVENYLKDNTDEEKFLSVKEDVQYFIKYLNTCPKEDNYLNVKIVEVSKRKAAERIASLKNTDYNSWLSFENRIGEPTKIDLVELLLEETFNKFICNPEIMNEIFNSSENLKYKFMVYLSQSSYNEELKGDILSKFLYYINNIQRGKPNLKEYNYKFNKSTTRSEDLFFYVTKFIIEENQEESNKIDIKKIFEIKK